VHIDVFVATEIACECHREVVVAPGQFDLRAVATWVQLDLKTLDLTASFFSGIGDGVKGVDFIGCDIVGVEISTVGTVQLLSETQHLVVLLTPFVGYTDSDGLLVLLEALKDSSQVIVDISTGFDAVTLNDGKSLHPLEAAIGLESEGAEHDVTNAGADGGTLDHLHQLLDSIL